MDKKVKEISSLEIDNKVFYYKDGFVKTLNDKGVHSIKVYCVIEDKDTNEEKKMCIEILGSKFIFNDISEEEWECCMKQ